MSVFVTGAGGFLGTTLCRRLVARGTAVHALVRRAHPTLEELPIEVHRGDLLEPRSLELALEDFVAKTEPPHRLIHAAGFISYRTRDAEQSRRVNVEGTDNVLAACRPLPIDRFCHVSSVVAVGHASPLGPALDESATYNGAPLRTHYVTTKRAAEDLVRAAVEEQDVVIVNPGAIYGAWEEANTTRFLGRLARGELGSWMAPGTLGVVGVQDVAEGCLLAMEHGQRGERYLLVESCWPILDIARAAAERFEQSPPRGAVAPGLWRIVVQLAGVLDRVRPLKLATPQALGLLGCHFRFDARRAREELGWRPQPFAEVLAETVDWMRAQGLGGDSPRQEGAA